MSYESAILIRLNDQHKVNAASFIAFCDQLEVQGYLQYSENDTSEISLEFFDPETDEEHVVEVNSQKTIADFLKQHAVEYTTIRVTDEQNTLEAEFRGLLDKLNEIADLDMQPAWQFSFGFGNVLDPVAGEFEGWSFFIDCEGYVPDFELIDRVFSNGNHIKKIRQIIKNIFACDAMLQGCLTG